MDLGAVFEDMRVGFGHLGQWARIAVVTDIDWIKHAVDLFKLLLPPRRRCSALPRRRTPRHGSQRHELRMNILISGAGIAGPTLADWLRRRGSRRRSSSMRARREPAAM